MAKKAELYQGATLGGDSQNNELSYLFDDLFASAGRDADGLADRYHIRLCGVAVPHHGSCMLSMVTFYIWQQVVCRSEKPYANHSSEYWNTAD